MKKILFLFLITFVFYCVVNAQPTNFTDSLTVKVANNTYWWAGIIEHGSKMPLAKPYQADFRNNCYTNQVQPLLLSTSGEVIWSEQPFAINFVSGKLNVNAKSTVFQYNKVGKNLKDAYHFASKNYFPPSGKMPDPLLFTSPQYNTWIELVYNQNQKDIMKYARSILFNGLPSGVLMIDDNWQEDYGNWSFHPSRFPNPKQMIDSLHTMGFKVMVWVCPFVSPDSYFFRDLMEKKYFVTNDNGYPSIINWWNGSSAELDMTNPDATKWFKAQLNHLTNDIGVDGFKLDAGDFEFYENVHSFQPDATPTDHCEAWAKIGLDYPLNEYRAMWKMGGQPLAERLHDKEHGFEALKQLIPNMLVEGLMGYYFSCPDMIGGGETTSFLNKEVLDQESIVRSAQCHALMPMMQFSVAPWRVLDEEHLQAMKIAVKIRKKFKSYILELAEKAAKTGEPIMKPMEFDYPNQGYATIVDQFLLGDNLLVAPVLVKGATTRIVAIPEGKWKSFDGQVFTGPKTVEVKVTLNDLPYFEKIK
jgi:alpha-glucosidase (family GH31 glycosyl hydrolase)